MLQQHRQEVPQKESTAEDLPWPDTDDEETVAWVEAQSADTVAPPAEGTTSKSWLN